MKKGSDPVWNPEALDWPFPPLADEQEMDEVRAAITAYLDHLAYAQSGRKGVAAAAVCMNTLVLYRYPVMKACEVNAPLRRDPRFAP